MIHVHALSVSLGHRQILHDVSFSAAPGALTAVIGPNGSGKSTLMKAICRDIAYDGDVSINGQEVAVEGKYDWRVRVPVETVRGWSAPYARTIEVSLRDPQTQLDATADVDLPIGLLGTLTDLAALEIRAR